MRFNTMSKVAVALMGTLFVGIWGTSAGTLNAAGDVKINKTNFPDSKFRTYVSQRFDYNSNGKLSAQEIRNATSIYITSDKVSSLKGIELLSNLRFISCDNNNLTSLDVSKNTSLTSISVRSNKLTSIKGLDKLKNLTSLNINSNKFKSLDLTNNKNLTSLQVTENDLSSIKGLSGLKGLQSFYCEKNNLTSLDLSKFENLRYLLCSSNKLTSLKLPSSNLTTLRCSENKLKSLDVSKCYYLKTLECSKNQLTKLELANPMLTGLSCANNKISELDISGSPSMTTLYCNNNKIKSLDVSSNKVLSMLYCSSNSMTDLKMANDGKMLVLICHNNKLTSLNVKGMNNLMILICSNNELKDLDIKDCENLEGICCLDNKFSTVDVSVVSNKKIVVYTDLPESLLETASESLDLEAVNAKSAKKEIKAFEEAVGSGGSVGSGTKFPESTWKSANTKIAKVEKHVETTAAGAYIYGVSAGATTVKCTRSGKTLKYKVHVMYTDVTDRDDFWFEPTRYLTEKGIVKGYAKQTEFRPDNKCTRAQMVTFIWRLKGEPKAKTKTCKFSDVKKTDYFYKAVLWGNENGIVEGYNDGTFGPQKECQRKHAVTFLWRLAGSPAPSTTKNKFKDVKKSDYFYKPVLWASEQKIVAGYTNGTFRPNGNCLRRQMVTFLYKYDVFVNDKK